MRISTNWINDYVDLKNVDLDLLANNITKNGINVEGVSSLINSSKLVVGKVIECSIHPNSDHLHICKVDVGNEILQIVCGASNVAKGQKVIVALIGAVLKDDFEIKKNKIRDVESFGMICALNELGLEDKSEGIYVLDENALVGSNPLKYLDINTDTLFTLDLNPNRGDCLSHLGFAYEVAAALNKKVNKPDIKYSTNDTSIKDSFNLEVETDNCSLFLLKLVKDVVIKESPKFIQERLLSAGMRPINNVVDISNYVMLEYGQPLHFYDADKLGESLGVRMAEDSEVLKTLDGKERELSKDDIVITDGKNPIGLAGVMGGFSTEVDNNTKNLIIESAIFDPVLIRKTSMNTGLRSEASIRFMAGLNYEYTYEALDRACNLLEKYAFCSICKDELIYDKVEKVEKNVKVSLENINKVLGVNMTREDVENSLDRLGFKYSNEFEVIIPNRRIDVSIKEDLIEEVGRIYGFDKIVSDNPIQLLKKGEYSPRVKYRKDISKFLRGLGINEVKSYSLIKELDAKKFNYSNKECVSLNKPISSDKTHIRTSLIASLIEINDYNYSRDVENINIYEISNTYHFEDVKFQETMKLGILLDGKMYFNTWNNTCIYSDYYSLKGIVEDMFTYLGFSNRVKFTRSSFDFLHPGKSADVLVDNEFVGFLGQLNPSFCKRKIYVCEIDLEKLFSKKVGKVKYIEPSKYPNVKRDVAFIFENDVNSIDVVKDIISVDKNIIKECVIFDEFKKEDKKSLAFALKFESFDKTLKEEEINDIFNKVISLITKKYNAILRDK